MGRRYRWNGFTLDLDAYRLDRDGVPVALEPKAFDLLVLLVQRSGRLVSKQEIFETLWRETAVTDHALTRIVAQLRRALGDEAREARYIETVPTRGYRWIRPLLPAVADLTPEPAAARPPEEPAPKLDRRAGPRRPLRPAVTAGLAAAAGGLAIIAWTIGDTPTATGRSGAPSIAWPVQVTTHAGLDLHPALSPHGDAIAYASDREGPLEIYVRALGGAGTDTALTVDGGQNTQPAWSPDGVWIAYHSARHGGIWVVPARGGVARQVSTSRPRSRPRAATGTARVRVTSPG